MFKEVSVEINKTLKEVFYTETSKVELSMGYSRLIKIRKTVYLLIPSEVNNPLIDNKIDLKNDYDHYSIAYKLSLIDDPKCGKGCFEIRVRFEPKHFGGVTMLENQGGHDQ